MLPTIAETLISSNVHLKDGDELTVLVSVKYYTAVKMKKVC